MKRDKEAEVIALRQAIQSYHDTVDALLCFANCVTFDDSTKTRLPGSEFSFGKRMTTSAENQVAANHEVTPDATIQRNADFGFTAEAKSSLPRDPRQLDEEFEHVLKYNDSLLGWWTPTKKVNTNTTVVLIPYEYAVRFSEGFQKYLSANSKKLAHPYSLVKYTRDREPKFGEFIHLQEEDGNISLDDAELKEKLHYGKRILLEPLKANQEYGNIKYSDSEPPVQHTMILLWQHVFNSIKTNDAFVEETETYEIQTTLLVLTEYLKTHFGSKSTGDGEPSFPLPNWVRKAMDAFVRLKLAEKLPNDEYLVHYYELKKELIERFSGLDEPEPEQGTLF